MHTTTFAFLRMTILKLQADRRSAIGDTQTERPPHTKKSHTREPTTTSPNLGQRCRHKSQASLSDTDPSPSNAGDKVVYTAL